MSYYVQASRGLYWGSLSTSFVAEQTPSWFSKEGTIRSPSVLHKGTRDFVYEIFTRSFPFLGSCVRLSAHKQLQQIPDCLKELKKQRAEKGTTENQKELLNAKIYQLQSLSSTLQKAMSTLFAHNPISFDLNDTNSWQEGMQSFMAKPQQKNARDAVMKTMEEISKITGKNSTKDPSICSFKSLPSLLKDDHQKTKTNYYIMSDLGPYTKKIQYYVTKYNSSWGALLCLSRSTSTGTLNYLNNFYIETKYKYKRQYS